jgi:hypothetical protein
MAEEEKSGRTKVESGKGGRGAAEDGGRKRRVRKTAPGLFLLAEPRFETMVGVDVGVYGVATWGDDFHHSCVVFYRCGNEGAPLE